MATGERARAPSVRSSRACLLLVARSTTLGGSNESVAFAQKQQRRRDGCVSINSALCLGGSSLLVWFRRSIGRRARRALFPLHFPPRVRARR
jgi:hypothetical protein